MKQYRGCRGNDVADAAEDLARRGGGVIRVDEGPLPSPPLPTEECLKCAPGEVIVTGGKWCIGPEIPPPDPLPKPEPLQAPSLKEVHDTLEKLRQNGAVHAREENGMMTITSVSDPSLTVTTDTQTVYDWREKRSRPNIVEYRYKVIETWDEMAKRFGEQVCITETIDWAESVLFCRDRCDKEESTNRFHFSTCWERCLNIIL